MSEADIETLSVDLDVTAELTMQVTSTPPSKNSKKSRKQSAPKTITVTKNKEFSITLSDDKTSYTDLLQTMLDQHAPDGKKFTLKPNRIYSFKYFLPRTPKKNAIDVECFGEYKSMIRRLSKKSTPTVTLLIQFEAIKKSITIARQSDGTSADSGDEAEGGNGEEEEEEDSDIDSLLNGRIREDDLSELDVVLAENRNQILKKWSNGHNGDATYVYPDGVQLPLTPAMIQDWAIAMKDNVASINDPPRTGLFDPSNKRAVLNLSRRTAMAAPSPLDANALATVFAPISSAVAELAKASIHAAVPSTPSKRRRAESVTTPRTTRVAATDTSLLNSPNTLARFCKYMKDSRGVRKAPKYFLNLRDSDIGPDILGQMDIKELTNPAVGMSVGDAYRFKQAASEWLKSRATREPEAIETDPEFSPYVRTRDQADFPFEEAPNAQQQWDENKSVQYDLNAPWGEMSRWSGGPLIRTMGERRERDNHIKYQDPATLEWRPIPAGFTVPEKDDEVENGYLKEW